MLSKNSFTANTWLISNSTLFFTDQLLNDGIPLNAYSIFDLSKLTEAILFSDKILILPGKGTRSKLYSHLKLTDKKIIDVLDPSGLEVSKIIGILRGYGSIDDRYSHEFLKSINLEYLANVICDLFPISHEKALEGLVYAENWANENWDTPDWETSEWFNGKSNQEDMILQRTKPNFYSKFWSDSRGRNSFPQTVIAEAYLRSIIYLRISDLYGISYSPDSIRIPIVDFINKSIKENISNYNQLVINKLEEKNAKKIKSLNENITFNRFEVEIPSALSLILKEISNENRSKNDIMTKTLELRYNNKIENFRSWLSALGETIKNGNRKEIETKFKQLDEFIHNIDRSLLEKLIIDSISSDIPISLSSELSTSLSIKNIGMELYRYFKNKRLIFLKDLYKHLTQIESMNSLLNKVFDTCLSEDELKIFRNLRAFQKNYLTNN